MDFNLTYTSGNISVTFKKDDDYIDNICKIYIFVEDENTEIAYYVKEVAVDVNKKHFLNFVKKFLSNPEYRKTYIVGGNWEETMVLENKKTDINEECRTAISKLNNKETKKFSDFASLKTYGRDKFSNMKLDELQLLLKTKDIEVIRDSFEDNPPFLTTLRWKARGLNTEDAIRKVKTDLEINKNSHK